MIEKKLIKLNYKKIYKTKVKNNLFLKYSFN